MANSFPDRRARRIVGVNANGHVSTVDELGVVSQHGDARDDDLRNGHAAQTEPIDETTDESVATAADLIRCNSVVRWVWEGWIPVGVLTIMAADPGCGKTRFCADLARRIYNGMPWPDGKAATLPAGSTTLWVPADNQHPELGSLPGAFGFPPESLYLNAPKSNPFIGTLLDGISDLISFEKRIKKANPALVFIDTALNATDRSAHKPEDAKAFFVPLQQLAARLSIPLICVTHLNASGRPLGRRIEGQGRVVIMLEKPDPSQENRRRLSVRKSNSLYPPPLGVTMADHGNDYDTSPPEDADAGPSIADAGRRKARSSRLQEVCDWLTDFLSAGPRRVSHTRGDAEAAGFSSATLYAAVRKLEVEEYTEQGKKWWQLRANETPFDK
jgi:hypothetical protein